MRQKRKCPHHNTELIKYVPKSKGWKADNVYVCPVKGCYYLLNIYHHREDNENRKTIL